MKRTLLLLLCTTLSLAIMAQASNLPYSEDFDGSDLIPPEITLLNVDGNTPASAPASLVDSAFIVREVSDFESNVAYGVSYYDPEAAADDWLILPLLALTDNPVVSWKAVSLTSSGNYPDTYQVLVSTTDTDPASFTSLFEVEEEVRLSAGGPGVQSRSLDLAAYANQDVYIAFRLMTPDPGGDRLAIDDIRVMDLLHEGFENGIPDSWTVIDGGTAGMTWFQDDYGPFKGSYSAGIDCYDAGGNETDDWLITPLITVTEGHVFSFWAISADSDYPDDLHVMVSKTGVSAPDFTITVADLVPVSADGWNKYSFVLSDHAEISDGEQIYVGLHCDSEGSFLNVDEVMYGEYIPPAMIRAYAVSETAVDVVFDAELDRDYTPGEFSMDGTAVLTFTAAEVDAEDKTLLHLTGATPAMASDVIVDTLWLTGQDEGVEFYGGIMPLMYTSITNPGGSMDFDNHHATFKAIVMGINDDTSRVWFADAAGAHNGVNTYDMVTGDIALGDEILFYGKLSPYEHQTEIYPATALEVVSSGNALFTATAIDGADIANTIAIDSDPAEQYEGVLITLSGVEILAWDGVTFSATDDDSETTFYVGDFGGLPSDGLDENTLTVGSIYTLTGFGVGRSTDDEINDFRLVPRNVDDILETTSTEDKMGISTRVYPLPAKNELFIQSEMPLKAYRLHSLSGSLLASGELRGENSATLSLSELEAGLYILSLEDLNGKIDQVKVMKE